MTFFKELHRRNVFKVASVYLVTSWLVLQIFSVIAPYLNLPNALGTGVTVLLLVFFPFACILAWAFELTPDGLKRTHEVDEEDSIRHITGKKINNSLVFALIVSLAFISYQQWSMNHTTQTNITIAVLPFEDMSPDHSQEYFGDGMAEELLNSLAKIKALQVTARTSSFSFKNKDISIKDIGRSLGVNYILEGSIRKSADKLRITAQLINTETDFHLWSATYDRKLDDVFAIQDELTIAITQALKLTLLPQEKSLLAHKPTNNIQAYELLLKAQSLLVVQNAESVQQAIKALQQAIALDANFDRAKALLYASYYSAYSFLGMSLEEVKTKQTLLFSELVASQDISAEKYIAISDYLVVYLKNYSAAEQAILNAIKLNPSNITALKDLTIFQSYPDAIKTIKEAIKIAPLDISVKYYALRYYQLQGDSKKASEIYQQIEQSSQESHFRHYAAKHIYFTQEKNLNKAKAYLTSTNIKHNRYSEYMLIDLYLYQQQLELALSLLEENVHSNSYDDQFARQLLHLNLYGKDNIITNKQRQRIEQLALFLPSKLQKDLAVTFNIIIGDLSPILADKDYYQDLLTRAETLSANVGFSDELLIDIAWIYAQQGDKRLLDKVLKSIEHLIPWCQLRPVGRQGCDTLLYHTQIITDKEELLNMVQKSFYTGLDYRDKHLKTDARYMMLHDSPAFHVFADSYVANLPH
ncbi:hypothetical protein [Colwellia piezophila]|uniref:hypothetical protein n=1 Tax=Colwellia piezophila TaxID=211668 RepID=UPI0003754E05|nr:hypothetical protein [Colwellia piezophila]